MWKQQTLWLDPGWVFWRAAFYCGCGPYSYKAMEEKRERKRKNQRMGSISLWLISAHASPETIFSWPKWESTQRQPDNVPSSFSAWTELHSLCLSLWQLIMMSILSYLPRLWSAPNQRPALHRSTLLVPAPQTTAEPHCHFFFLDSSPLSSCLSFDFLLTPDKQTLTSVSGLGSVSTNFTLVTENSKPGLDLVFCHRKKRKKWFRFKANPSISVFFFFFSIGDCSTNVIIPLCQTISLFQDPIWVSFP